VSETIWKFDVKPGRFVVSMPRNARVLAVQNQGDGAVMWVLCDADERAPMEEREFMTIGTGHDASPVRGWGYVGSFQVEPVQRAVIHADAVVAAFRARMIR
jgi:hypothetical protein